jgi:hypothetical protein
MFNSFYTRFWIEAFLGCLAIFEAHYISGEPIRLNADFPNLLWMESSTVGLANTCSSCICVSEEQQLNLGNALIHHQGGVVRLATFDRAE